MLAVARMIGWAADWRTLRSRPVMARIVERTGLSLRTCQRWCRWLEARGLLRVLDQGSTPQFSPGVLAKDGPNSAREWLLVDPAVTPSGLDFDPGLETPTRTPARGANSQQEGARRPAGRRDVRVAWSVLAKPCDSTEGGPVTGRPHPFRDHLVLRRISPGILRYTLRPYAVSGWRTADILQAIEHRPDGRRWMHGDAVRVPHRWLAHRLAAWLGGDGRPLPPHSAGLARRAERARAERFVAPPPVPPAVARAGAELARELLACRGRDLTPRIPLGG